MNCKCSRLGWLLAYLLMLAGVSGGLLQARGTMTARLDTPEARAEWEAWRRQAQAQSEGVGPVQRKVPLSAEPPTLVLLRDHFPLCLAGALLFASLLFAAMMMALRGVLQGKVDSS